MQPVKSCSSAPCWRASSGLPRPPPLKWPGLPGTRAESHAWQATSAAGDSRSSSPLSTSPHLTSRFPVCVLTSTVISIYYGGARAREGVEAQGSLAPTPSPLLNFSPALRRWNFAAKVGLWRSMLAYLSFPSSSSSSTTSSSLLLSSPPLSSTSASAPASSPRLALLCPPTLA